MELGSLRPSAIISYHRMCTEEHEVRLQRGMNFRLDPRYSVMLMSRREGAPYADAVEDGGEILIYEGHDASRVAGARTLWRSTSHSHTRRVGQLRTRSSGRRPSHTATGRAKPSS